MRREWVGPAEAPLSMLVMEATTNGQGVAHGGSVFLLADTAFGCACNSHNQRCMARHCSIAYRPTGQPNSGPGPIDRLMA